VKVGKQELNYRELQVAIHDNAVKKGFWEKPNYHSFVTDIIEEVVEFVKAFNSDKNANVVQYEKWLYNNPESQEVKGKAVRWRNVFEKLMKDTAGDELADVDMLTMSLAEGWGIKIDKSCFPKSDMILNVAASSGNVFMMINRLTYLVSKLAGAPVGGYGANPVMQILFCQVLYTVEFIAEYLKIDLPYHIKHKMDYNKDRAHLHGKTK